MARKYRKKNAEGNANKFHDEDLEYSQKSNLASNHKTKSSILSNPSPLPFTVKYIIPTNMTKL